MGYCKKHGPIVGGRLCLTCGLNGEKPRSKFLKRSPLPWRIETGGKKKMSAIVAANGRLVAGSLICEQDEETIANHKFILAALEGIK